MKTLLFLFIVLSAAAAGLYIAKASLNLDTMTFKVERPVTGLLTFCAIIAAMIEDKIIEKLINNP